MMVSIFHRISSDSKHDSSITSKGGYIIAIYSLVF